MARLDGKVALITGGGSGIGRACAVLFAREGAMICAADLNLEGAAETVQQVEAASGKAMALQVDTADEAACDAMVARCVEAYGAVDVLVAAAGILGQEGPGGHTRMLSAPIDLMRKVIEINLWGVLYSNRAAARWMVENNRPGSIINFASAAAKIPTGSAGGAYSISKAGVWMATKVLAAELATKGIRVNAVGPGSIETPMTAALFADERQRQIRVQRTPMRRPGQPEEVASVVLFLASEDASYVTGEILHPAGGMFLG